MSNIIETKNLTFYYERKEIIKQVNFTVKEGQIVTMIGNTGGGKTTLVKLLTGLLDGRGEILLLGHPLINNDRLLQQHLGVVLGNPHYNFVTKYVKKDLLFPLENLQYGSDEMTKYLDDVVELFEIESLLTKPVKELTNEQAAIVALASAMITKPRLLILDDAFSQIGPVEKKRIWKLLGRYQRQNHMTILNVTHDIEESLYGDTLVVLNDGSIVLEIPVDEISAYEKELKQYHYELPFMVELSKKLQYYNVIDHTVLDMGRMVNQIWK
ncbi:MAG: ATP-binding cassette domain-containing protein [Bacilli bacterium]|jgi:energy-coupling factor transport system ATP-binding protein|nr:ATP-binding cassette domain-containing protein [Bacilli bacterium]